MDTNQNESTEFEFGIYSLGELIPGPSGQSISASKRIEEIIAAAKLADEAGLDLFGIGEHIVWTS
jgi:hypothetical protein